MKLYEYQGKRIFAEYGIEVPAGEVATSPEEAGRIASRLGEVVLKAQVLTGGRGKAGGVRFASSPEEAERVAAELFAMELGGERVTELLVEQRLKIRREIYAGVTIDRALGKPVVMVSGEGGVDIEEVAERSPEKIFSRHVDPFVGFYPYMARELASRLSLEREAFIGVAEVLLKLYRIFTEKDAQLVEVNPLAVTDGGVVAADAKVIVDEDALFRQDFGQRSRGMPYVRLEGSIGCVVNGAGLAMATMDTLKHLGGEPANFLDIGGGAGEEVMREALLKVASHPGVRVIFVNILGGITRCDEIARGILAASRSVDVPLVVRFRGTNEEEGVRLLREAGIEVERDMIEAARMAVEMSRRQRDEHSCR
ncbi:MAG: ADP-forming succinate--CoA ligase subunit beta [Euryarchaeota archaeon]|nr:ADP-forming succinate--CoA ligase subunit beta [Euryarchaeota archaeon]